MCIYTASQTVDWAGTVAIKVFKKVISTILTMGRSNVITGYQNKIMQDAAWADQDRCRQKASKGADWIWTKEKYDRVNLYTEKHLITGDWMQGRPVHVLLKGLWFGPQSNIQK